jgi:hypothetical protein
MSKRLMKAVMEYHNKQNNPWLFFEWTWPTVAKMNGLNLKQYSSTYFAFRPIMPITFNNFKQNMIYHPVKTDIGWRSVLERISKQ